MAWISVEQTLIGKKLRVLAKDLGCSQNEAIGILINLWLWGMDNASMDGLMDGAEIADIALAIKPCLSESLDPEEVVGKLLDNGWIDCNEEELFIHDWEEYRYYYNKYVSEKKQHSKRQREYVARKRAAEKAATKPKEQKEQKSEKTIPEEKPVKKSPYTTAFETLWSTYPRKKDKKYREVTFDKYEVREENKKVFEMAKKYADRFQDMYKKNQGLLLYGPVGTGKSFTAACIGNYLLDNAKPVIMTSFVKILQDIWENDREAEYITILNSASLLIVDDLGTERETDYALEKVYNIIDSRVRANKPMIITSNLELNDMMECEDIRKKRIYDRILECCYPMYVGGKSFRMMKAAQRFDEMKDFLEE